MPLRSASLAAGVTLAVLHPAMAEPLWRRVPTDPDPLGRVATADHGRIPRSIRAGDASR